MECGLASAGSGYRTATPAGTFCRVDFTVLNGSDRTIDVSSRILTGRIGSAYYDADSSTSSFGGESYSREVNPGLSVAATVYVDVPAGSTLEIVDLDAAFFGSSPVSVRVG